MHGEIRRGEMRAFGISDLAFGSVAEMYKGYVLNAKR
jgi:hypothetical protein